MWKWLVGTLKPRHPLDRDLGTARALRRFTAALPAERPQATLRAVARVFAQASELGLASAARLEALSALDVFAQPACRRLFAHLLDNPARQVLDDDAWQALFDYHGAIAQGYAHSVEALALAKADSALHANATLAACRAVRALAKCNMLMRMRYRDPQPGWWPRFERLLASLRARSQPSALLALYPDDAGETCLAREYLVALLFEVAPHANLLPGQIHGVDLLLRQYAADYRMGDAFDAVARPFALDTTGAAKPLRWLEKLPLRAGLRFFGLGEAAARIHSERERATAARGIPDWLAPSQLSVERYREMLERLAASWSLAPPARRQQRSRASGEILVAHQLAEIRRLVGFSELARAGRSLEYDHFSAYAINSIVRGKGDPRLHAPSEPKPIPDEEALRNLETFERALEPGAIEVWRMADASESGLGVETIGPCEWGRVGMLIAYRRPDSAQWSMAVVRRLGRTGTDGLRIGLLKLPGIPYCARVAVNDPRQHPGKAPSGPSLNYDAIKLVAEESCLLLPPGLFDPAWRYVLTVGQRWDPIRMQRCIECGFDFEQIAFTIERSQQAA